MAATTKIPQLYLCSISHQILVDPVQAEDGHTYERESIEMWLKTHHTSPKTNVVLSSLALVPNIYAKQAVDAFLSQHPDLWHTNEVFLPESWMREVKAAVISKDLNKIQQLVSRHPGLLTRPYTALDHHTLLQLICQHGNVPIFEWVITKLEAYKPGLAQSSLMTTDSQGRDGLQLSMVGSNTLDMLEAIAKIKSPERQWSVLHWAINNDDMSLLTYALSCGAATASISVDGETALHMSIWRQRLHMAMALVKNGADINAQDTDGRSPLYLAVQHHWLPGVEWLLSQGANTEIRDLEGRTALHMAVSHIPVSKSLIRALLLAGTDLKTQDHRDQTPLMILEAEDLALAKDVINLAREIKVTQRQQIQRLVLQVGEMQEKFLQQKQKYKRLKKKNAVLDQQYKNLKTQHQELSHQIDLLKKSAENDRSKITYLDISQTSCSGITSVRKLQSLLLAYPHLNQLRCKFNDPDKIELYMAKEISYETLGIPATIPKRMQRNSSERESHVMIVGMTTLANGYLAIAMQISVPYDTRREIDIIDIPNRKRLQTLPNIPLAISEYPLCSMSELPDGDETRALLGRIYIDASTKDYVIRGPGKQLFKGRLQNESQFSLENLGSRAGENNYLLQYISKQLYTLGHILPSTESLSFKLLKGLPDGRLLIFFSHFANSTCFTHLYVWDFTNTCYEWLAIIDGSVNHFLVLRNHRFAIYTENGISIWDARTCVRIRSFGRPSKIDNKENIVVLADDRIAQIRSGSKNIDIWDVNTGKLFKTLLCTHSPIKLLNLPNAKLLSISKGMIGQCFDVESGESLHLVNFHIAQDLNFDSRDHNRELLQLALVNHDDVIMMFRGGRYDYDNTLVGSWNLKTGICMQTLAKYPHTGEVNDMIFVGKEKLIVPTSDGFKILSAIHPVTIQTLCLSFRQILQKNKATVVANERGIVLSCQAVSRIPTDEHQSLWTECKYLITLCCGWLNMPALRMGISPSQTALRIECPPSPIRQEFLALVRALITPTSASDNSSTSSSH